MNGADAVELIMAGAQAIGIGTAIYYRGIEAFQQINKEIEQFMKNNNYRSIKDMVGLAHK